MNNIRKFCEDGYVSYDTIIKSFGFEILLKVDDNDYQGDTRVLFRNGNRYGILFFGWGSCSGCDALEACYGDINEIEKLANELEESIKWDSLTEIFRYFIEHDWKGDYSWHADETRIFIEKSIEILRKELKNHGLTK